MSDSHAAIARLVRKTKVGISRVPTFDNDWLPG